MQIVCYNMAAILAHIVVGLKKHDHITQVRKELHRLPIEARCKFKIITDLEGIKQYGTHLY